MNLNHLDLMQEFAQIIRGDHPAWGGSRNMNGYAFLRRIADDSPEVAEALACDVERNVDDFVEETGVSPRIMALVPSILRGLRVSPSATIIDEACSTLLDPGEDVSERYVVTVPIAGTMTVEVEVPAGSSKEDIFYAALDAYGTRPDDCVVEWEFHSKIVEGNVLHASTNEWSCEDVTEADDDE